MKLANITVLALLGFATTASAALITYQGTADGYFGVTPGTHTVSGLTYTPSANFNCITDATGFCAIGGAVGNDLGTFTLGTTAASYEGVPWTLLVTFNAPPGVPNPVTGTAVLHGTVNLVAGTGGVNIAYSFPQSLPSQPGHGVYPVTYPGGTFYIHPDDTNLTDPTQAPGGISTAYQGVHIHDSPAVQVIPEPSTYALIGGGLALIGLAARRRRKV